MNEPKHGIDQICWLPVENAAGETIPAFAAMRITGINSTTKEFTVAKPNSNDAVSNILFNGPCEIYTGLSGIATADMPAAIRYDTADGTPSNGDEWGVSSGDWKLRNARSGFLIQGVMDSTVGIASAVRNQAASTGGTELKGLTFTSDTDSTADSDPGNGLFKWNNATQGSATVLYFDNLTADGVSSATFFGTLVTNGCANGTIYLQQSDDSTKWQLWKWTATPTAGAGYYKFTVTLQANGGSIADAKTVYTLFTPSFGEFSAGMSCYGTYGYFLNGAIFSNGGTAPFTPGEVYLQFGQASDIYPIDVVNTASGHTSWQIGLDTTDGVLGFDVDATSAGSVYKIAGTSGVSGSFTTVDGKTVTVTGGIITNIV